MQGIGITSTAVGAGSVTTPVVPSAPAPLSGIATGTVGDHLAGAAHGSGSALAATNVQSGAATQVIGHDPHASERAERNQLTNHMLQGSGIGTQSKVDKHRREVISNAMDAYSLDQLKAINKDNVHFKVGNLRPPNWKPGQEYEDGEYHFDDNWSATTDDKGVLVPGSVNEQKIASITLDRQMLDDATPDGVGWSGQTTRHELAHAWDDAQCRETANPSVDSQGKPILKNGQMILNATPDYESQTDQKLYTDPSGKGWSIKDMYASYTANLASNPDNYVGAHGTPATYAAINPQEFYAEGYSVFHGDDPDARVRMKAGAPEYYAYLMQDAQQRGTLPAGL